METIEVIARALVIKNNKVLTCVAIESGNHFLPGGHVEFGESAEVTLVREMKEEAGAVIGDIKYLGLFENTYGEGTEVHHEVNIIYTAQVEDEHIVSQESHIAFEWVPISEFGDIKFLPEMFRNELVKYFAAPRPIYLSTVNQ